LIYSFLNCSLINSHFSSLSFLDKGYTFSFLSTNPYFTLIAWFHTFFIGVFLLTFFLKTWIYLWNLGGTNFLASSSDFTASFFLFQISHFSAIFFYLHCSFFFDFSCFPSSIPFSLILFLLFFSLYFYFYHPGFPYFGLYYFLYSSGHLIIFTSCSLINFRIMVSKL